MTLKVLDLFSGIGGFSLGLERAGMETVAFCEIEPFCQKVLKKHWPEVPVFNDIRKLKADDLPEQPDLICGGYPCQPFSVAGKQRGKDDNRHLWPEMFRLIKECRSCWVIGENVAGHIRLGLDGVLSDLESEGYAWETFIIPACGLNAPHKRERVWVVGYAEHDGSSAGQKHRQPDEDARTGKEGQEPAVEPAGEGRPGDSEALADPQSQRIQGRGTSGQQKPQTHAWKKVSLRSGERSWETQWQAEPDVGRVADGIPSRVDRIKALGNSLVPQISEVIGRCIMESLQCP